MNWYSILIATFLFIHKVDAVPSMAIAPTNDDCTNAIPITPALGNEGCVRITLPFSTDGTTDSGTNATCAGNNTGLDQFFTWTATKPGLIWRSLTPGTPGIAIYENVGTTENPQCGNEIACTTDNAFTDTELNGWNIGDKLIIQIFDETGSGSTSDVAFCLREAITCTPPTASFVPEFDCNNNNYTIKVTVSNLGDADSLAIVQSGDTLATGVKIGTTTLGPFSLPSNLILTLAHNNDTICNVQKTFDFENCPPPNDICANPTTVSEIPTDGINCATISGTLVDATDFDGIVPTCDIAGFDRFNVFYTFTATSPNLTFEQTAGTGSAVSILILASCNGAAINGSCGSLINPKKVTGLTVGTDYILVIWASKSSIDLQLGTFDICIRKTPDAPSNDDCASAISIPDLPTDGTCATILGTTESATASGPSTTCSGNFGLDLFYTFTATATNMTFEETRGQRAFTTFRMVLWDACNGTEVNGSCGLFPNTITGLDVGTTYILELMSTSSPGPFEVCLKAENNVPSNNDCANAIAFLPIPADGTCAVISGTTTNAATSSANSSCDFSNEKDVFYTFVATGTTLRFEETIGTAEDLEMTIFTACDGTELENSCNRFPKTITGFTINQTYVLRVWNRFTEMKGTFDLCIKKVITPTNDDCANPIPFPTIPTDGTCATVSGSTQNGLTSDIDPSCDDLNDIDVYFSFVATTTDLLFEQILGTAPSLEMTVLESCDGTEVAGSCGNFPKIVNNLTIGNTYLLRVWNDGPEGTGSFNINAKALTGPPPNDECANALELPVNPRFGCQLRTSSTNLQATASPQTDDVTGTPNDDVWFSFVATNAAHFVVLFDRRAKVGGSTAMALAAYDGSNGCDNLLLLADAAGTFLSLTNLTIGQTYFVRVYGFNQSSSAQTTFDICIDTPVCGINILEIIQGECTTPNDEITLFFNYNFTDAGNEFQVFVDDNLVKTVQEDGTFLQQVSVPVIADSLLHTLKITSSTNPDCAGLATFRSNPNPCPTIIQMPEGGNAMTTVCEGIFVDPGGIGGDFFSSAVETGNFPNCGCTSTQTLCSGTADPISVDFRYMDIGGGTSDELIIYDGATTNSPILHNSDAQGERINPSKITSTGSCLTFVFTATSFTSGAGWEAIISCGEGGFNACTDGFIGNNQLTGTQSVDAQFETNQGITSEQKIQNAATVDYDAGTSITLLPGFEVTAGATFHAFIDGCPSTVVDVTSPAAAKLATPTPKPFITEPTLKVYPNPTYHQTNVILDLPHPTEVHLAIYDINGRMQTTLISNQTMTSGSHTLQWDSQQVEAGIYFLVLNGRPLQKLVVIR